MSVTFEVTGVGAFLAMLHSLQGPQLQSVTRKSLSNSARAVIVPAIAAGTPRKYGGHLGPYPTRGLLSKTQKITSRMVRTRPGEFVAISTKPRLWFLHMVVRGTAPHVITARSRVTGSRASRGDVRGLNRANLAGGAAALAFNGRFRAEVQHPGAKPTDYIRSSVAGKERGVLDMLTYDLIAQAAAAGRTVVIP